ncbi:MAG: HupE/UreJ family protein [Blastochloris sp.]|nr:HupE/UreJ family protein [Blastochloris sp.]
MKSRSFPLLVMLFFLLPSLAQAHTGQGHDGSFMHGVAHPLTGWDHLLAMVAVGLWAVALGGRARWVLPLGFVGFMLVGGLLGMQGLGLPLVERGIQLSVLVLGLALALALRPHGMLSLMLVAGFALFHGQAHGAEMPQMANAGLYFLGFALATTLLHGLGLALGFSLQRVVRQASSLRWAGLVIFMMGLVLVWR